MDEPTDADVRPSRVARVALALLGALLAATVLAWLAWRAWRPDALNSGLTMQVQGPMLESSPQADLAAFRRAQLAQTGQWGWVRGEPGVARIPVREAMLLLAERDAAARAGGRK
jgi:hypothetical protein